MTNEERYFAHVSKERGPRVESRLRHQMQLLYSGVDFHGKSVLDIGGGTGVHSLYAAARGASDVVVVEPEADGGHGEMISTFRKWRDALGLQQVSLIQNTFQEFDDAGRGFDIVLIQDAINHFDEPACITLRSSQASQRAYDLVFDKIAKVVRPGGTLMLSDCSSRNVFPMLGMRNPFDPMIEWHKHQPPSVWAGIARRHGFEVERLRWSSPSRAGSIGQLLFGNAAAAWFFTSHFALTLRRGAA